MIEEIEEEILIDEEELSEYQQKRFGPRGDLIIQKQQLIQPIQDQIFNAIRELAKSRNYDFIFDKSADIVMLYSDKRYDVSDQILRTISRANNRKKVDSRKDKREIENESLIDETTVVSDIENKEKEDISDEKVSTPNKKLTVKELLEQRKQTKLAISSGSAILPRAIFFKVSFNTVSLVFSFINLVFVKPGRIQLALMLYLPNS